LQALFLVAIKGLVPYVSALARLSDARRSGSAKHCQNVCTDHKTAFCTTLSATGECVPWESGHFGFLKGNKKWQ